ncbi:cytochrome c [Craurococcus roseus]|uniref:Cytochrome c n=1 Tax=Craurococcus roseus TaxID=77585 RepID=A0ABP3QMV8_9PROT
MALAAALVFAGAAGLAPAQERAAAGDPRAGRRLAGGQCAACHGNDGIAVLPEAPNLAGQKAGYTAAQLRHYRSGERKHEQMTVVSQGLSDQQIADLAAWYEAIQVEATVPGR